MKKFSGHMARGLFAAAGLALVVSTPALAQSSNSASSGTSGNGNGSKMALGDKAPSGSLVKTDGDWRGSEVIGATVYNDQGDSVGTVSDLLMAPDGTVSNAILSVGGFLGIGSKLIEVPLKNLKFVPSESNPASGSKEATQSTAAATGNPQANAAASTGAGAAGSGAGTMPNTTAGNGGGAAPAANTAPSAPAAGRKDFSLVLPGATKQSLTSDPTFKFAD